MGKYIKKKIAIGFLIIMIILGISPYGVYADQENYNNSTNEQTETVDKIYTVSSNDELKNCLEQIKNGNEQNIVILLQNDVTAPNTSEGNYFTTFGVEGKHITIRSDGNNLKKINFLNRCILNGSCTFDNVYVTGRRIYCNGYKTIFTDKGEIHLTETLYGGGYKSSVESTYVVIAANGEINPNSTNGLHNIIGGSYQGSVDGDTYLEVKGNIQMTNGNHLNPGSVMGDGSSGDGLNGSDVYVGGNATLIYDNSNSKTSPAIEGTYGCEMKKNVTLNILSGRATEICGTQEYSTKSIIRGDLHIVAGATDYENTNRVLRLNYNWPIVGAGNRFATEPGAVGNYTVGGNITIDTYENVWGWDKGTTPTTDDLPEIYGAIRGNVGGNITINAHGTHVNNIFGASSSSNIAGDVTINATDVDLKNCYYEEEDDQGDILVNYKSTVNGKSIINIDGGDINIIRLTTGKQVNDNSTITIKGTPKIRTGVLSTTNYSSSPDLTPIIYLDSCHATIPFIQSAACVNVKNNSNVTLNGLWLDKDLVVNEGSTLKTNSDVVELDGNAIINGVWQQLYNQSTSDEYDCSIGNSLNVGKKGQYISYGSTEVMGNVLTEGMIALMKPSLFKSNYESANSNLRLPKVEMNKNYNLGMIPLKINGESTGVTKVNIVKEDDWETLQMPLFGSNYIISKKNNDNPKQNTFTLGNEEAISKGFYLKRLNDVAETNDNFMWQIAKKISITFDKNGGETDANPNFSSQDCIESQSVYHFSLPTTNPTRQGYEFVEWNTQADGKGSTFNEKTDVTQNIIVYAQWKNDLNSKSISLNPMNITIYTGGNGYSGVIGSNGTFSKNDLPEIGFYVILPDELNTLIGSSPSKPIDLSDKLTLSYNDDKGITRLWKLMLYGDKEHSQTVVNGQTVYIYKLSESKVNGSSNLIPARFQFTGDDGKVMVDSKFPVSLKDQFRNYKMQFYTGNLSVSNYKINLLLDNQVISCPVNLGEGVLKVRGNVNQYYSNIDSNTPTIEKKTPNKIYAQSAQSNTRYFINDSNVEVLDEDGVKLLVDKTLDDTLLKRYLNKQTLGKYSYDFSYLDLVDTSNGNDYLSLKDGQKIQIYWPVPQDAKENSSFHIVHFKGLSRDSNDNINDLLDKYIPEELNCEIVTIDGQKFVRFSTESFSPFALLYEKKVENTDGINEKDKFIDKNRSHNEEKEGLKINQSKQKIDTGDNTYIIRWIIILIISSLGCILLITKKRTFNKEK